MNGERLLAHYGRIADAPDAIARLRRFILDLAVRGKLVDTEFDWRFCTLGDVGAWGSGGTPTRTNAEFYGGTIPWLVIGDLNDGVVTHAKTHITQAGLENSSAKIVEQGTVLIAMYGSIGKLGVAGIRCATNQAIAHCEPDQTVILTEYLLVMLRSLREDFLSKGQGVAQQNISQKILKAWQVQLPPLAEQHRIVAKVDELMGLCDRLEAAQAGREATRDRLEAASLARLNTPDPETFQADARFALDALPALTTRPDQIKRLRQTILNLAVRGKLVPQDPNDEPASELLKRIAKEKARAGKREKVETEIDNGEKLGELPRTWRTVPLIALGFWAIGSGFPKNEQGLESGPHFFLKVSDMNLPGNEKYITTSNNFIDDDAAQRMRAKIHPPGTIIFPKIGGAIATNKRRILTRGSAIDNNCLGITFSSALNIEWAFLLLTTLDFTRYQAGTAVPALQQGVLERIPVGLPPLAEQHRIVAKVDALMVICDRLEASLTATSATRRRLLDALLDESLAGPESVAA